MKQTTFIPVDFEKGKSDYMLRLRANHAQTQKDTKSVNTFLYELGKTYHDSVPLAAIHTALHEHGFDAAALCFLVCGRNGNLHETVGRNRWLSMSWHVMGSGRYEVIAYVS